MNHSNIRVNSQRLWKSLLDLSKIGATEKGGVCRVALTDRDREGRDLVTQWLRDAGMSVRIDQLGNIFARRPGTSKSHAAVATGSHIDTQPSGGKFDGNYGVLAGLEVVRVLNEHSISTSLPVEICIWTNEEGSRFTPVMMGSGGWAGVHALDGLLQRKDIDGISVGEELHRIGYAGPEPLGPTDRHPTYTRYFEAHIEQGPVLEASEKLIGVVTGALGTRWFDVEISGLDAHAGSTPMHLRKDALRAAARLIDVVHEIGVSSSPESRGTVGSLRVYPNSRNTIPGKVNLTVDFRSENESGLSKMEDRLHIETARLEKLLNVTINLTKVSEFKACEFDSECIQIVEDAANLLQLSNMRLISGAGHDAIHVAKVCPTSMIFIPCKDGISHNEIEEIKPEEAEAGANVLLHAILRAAS